MQVNRPVFHRWTSLLIGVLVVLPWLIAAAFVILCPLALAIWAEDGPRNDDPPDTGNLILLAA